MVAFLFGLLAVACGGGDNEDADFDPLGYEVRRLSSLVVEQLGQDTAFDAIIFAYERGYSPGQVFQAIEDAWLRPDGRVQSADGSKGLTPAGEPLGLVMLPDTARLPAESFKLVGFESSPASAPRSAPVQEPKPSPLTVDHLRQEAKSWVEEYDDPTAVTGGLAETYIVWLGMVGYSAEQIVEALILGTDADSDQESRGFCIWLKDSSGKIIVPMDPTRAGDACRDAIVEFASKQDEGTSSSEPEPSKDDKDEPAGSSDDRVGFYAGTLELVQCGADCGVQCEITRDWRLAVNADGSVRGSTPAQARWTLTDCVEPLEGGWGVEGGWTPDGLVRLELGSFVDAFAVVRGELEGGRLTLSLDEDPRPGDAGRIVQFEAVLTRE